MKELFSKRDGLRTRAKRFFEKKKIMLRFVQQKPVQTKKVGSDS